MRIRNISFATELGGSCRGRASTRRSADMKRGMIRMEQDNSTEAAVADLKAKQNKQAKWAKIGGILVVVAALIRGVSFFLASPELKDCDDSSIASTVTSIFQDSLKSQNIAAKVTGMTNVMTVSRADKVAMCSAKVSFSDGSTAAATYEVTPDKVTIKSSNAGTE